MKKAICSILWIALVSVGLLVGCSDRETINKEVIESKETSQETLNVFVSFYPYYEIAKKIGGDKIQITSMIPSGAEAHDFEPSIKQMMELQEADVFIYNGLEFEEWTEKALHSLPKDQVKIVEGGKWVTPIPMEEEHEEEQQEEEEEHRGEYDPHIWLDPINVKVISEKVKDTFIALDEKNKDYYEENYIVFKEELEKLDQAFKDAFQNVSQREILVSHAAFSYFTKRYNLNQLAVSGVTPDEEPNPKSLVELSKLVEEKNIKYIFMETLSTPKTSEVLAKEANIEVLPFYTVEGLTEEEEKNGEDYISLMYKNLENLKKALVK